jgi:hypothetical protein
LIRHRVSGDRGAEEDRKPSALTSLSAERQQGGF